MIAVAVVLALIGSALAATCPTCVDNMHCNSGYSCCGGSCMASDEQRTLGTACQGTNAGCANCGTGNCLTSGVCGESTVGYGCSCTSAGCAGAMTCGSGSTCSYNVLGAGAKCDSTNTCLDNLSCLSGVCTASSAGGFCVMSAFTRTQKSLAADGSNCTSGNYCSFSSGVGLCTATLGTGGNVTGHCFAGLSAWCTSGQCSGGSLSSDLNYCIEVPVALNAACQNTAQCGTSAGCQLFNSTMSNYKTCINNIAAGYRCGSSSGDSKLCASGLSCYTDFNGQARCRAAADFNGQCYGSQQCPSYSGGDYGMGCSRVYNDANGYVVPGTCNATRLGAACTTDNDCPSNGGALSCLCPTSNTGATTCQVYATSTDICTSTYANVAAQLSYSAIGNPTGSGRYSNIYHMASAIETGSSDATALIAYICCAGCYYGANSNTTANYAQYFALLNSKGITCNPNGIGSTYSSTINTQRCAATTASPRTSTVLSVSQWLGTCPTPAPPGSSGSFVAPTIVALLLPILLALLRL